MSSASQKGFSRTRNCSSRIVDEHPGHARSLRPVQSSSQGIVIMEGPFWDSRLGDELQEGHIHTRHVHPHPRFHLGPNDEAVSRSRLDPFAIVCSSYASALLFRNACGLLVNERTRIG